MGGQRQPVWARGRHEVTGALSPEEAGDVLVSVETHRKR